MKSADRMLSDKWKAVLIAFGVLTVISGGIIASGSLPGVLFGANELQMNGHAAAHGGEYGEIAAGWAHYGGDEGGSRYSNAEQITRENVRSLKQAWRYETGDLARPEKIRRQAAAEATPILVADSLVFCTPFNEVIALDPGTGAQRWRFDPKINLEQRPANQFTCRGVAYWKSGSEESCSERIFTGTNDSRLIALDARSGALCEGFGDNGVISVDPGMDLVWPGEFQFTSPPAVLGDTIIVGSSISDNARVAAPSGIVRAYDARTGAMKWTFDPIPREADSAYANDWRGGKPVIEGHANVWAPMSIDRKRGLVFLPTSSASPDFYGGLRPGDNRHANSVVALNAENGEIVWARQLVHHDVWDYDLPAQPGLYSVWRNGRSHDVVAQVTKTGHVFVLDRETGEPFLPIEERSTPQDAIYGEALSPTQPFPLTPAIVPDRLSPSEAFGLTVWDRGSCRRTIESARADGLFTPPSVGGTILRPANLGGANWGGAAFDPARNLLVVNMSNIAHLIHLIPAADVEAAKEVAHDAEISPQSGAPYGVRRDVLLSPLGLPCSPPPWGVIAGVDIASGEIVWRKRFGTTKDLAGGIALPLGTPNIGGPMTTAGGLVFIGAAMDNYLRAFDVETGEEIWKGRLPAGGQATPMSYEWEGRQYIVINAGGHGRMQTTLGDSLVAFALPE